MWTLTRLSKASVGVYGPSLESLPAILRAPRDSKVCLEPTVGAGPSRGGSLCFIVSLGIVSPSPRRLRERHGHAIRLRHGAPGGEPRRPLRRRSGRPVRRLERAHAGSLRAANENSKLNKAIAERDQRLKEKEEHLAEQIRLAQEELEAVRARRVARAELDARGGRLERVHAGGHPRRRSGTRSPPEPSSSSSSSLPS